MTVRRSSALVAAVGIVAVTGVWPTSGASAHGAPSSPVSRAFACRADGASANEAACRAALAANGRPFGSWDNLRVPGVAGQDRQYIPDGQLCSASLPEFRGLDLTRADWPSTTLEAGQALTVRYSSTIPHRGSFRVYLTRVGYNPAQALRWADLDASPLLTATDPPLRDGVYTFGGTLPADRTGRHVLYTIWQNSDTPDTYYSCSDVVLTASGAAAGGAPPPAGAPEPERNDGGSGVPPTVAPTQPGSPAPSPGGPGDVPPPPPPDGARVGVEAESWLSVAEPAVADRIALGQQIMSAALIVIVGVTAGLAYLRMRAARPQGSHRRPGSR